MAKQLHIVDLVAPGNRGINREQRSKLLPVGFATKATNFVISRDGLLTARDGKVSQTATPIGSTPNVETLFEYVKADATTERILAWDGGISNDISNPSGSDISGALTDTNGTWWMQNFNDKCLAFQSGQKFAVYTGSTFATVSESSGTASTSGIAAATLGRVWHVSNADGAVLKYSGLLDETDWGGAGSGSIDFSKIWTQGQDRITAITGFNGGLVVFGMRHIVFLVDGSGSELGLDPTTAYVADIIGGTGCVDQQTLQQIGETDLVFLSTHGVQTLSRLVQEKSNPTFAISKYIRTELLEAYRAETAGAIRSVYNPDEGLYILTFPASAKSYVFDVRSPYKDEDGDTVVPIFEWDLAPTSWVSRENGVLLMGGAGEVFEYTGTTDDGTDIALTFETAWLDIGEEFGNRLKILKKLGAIILTPWAGNVVFKWYVDFSTAADQYTKTFTTTGTQPEFGVALWGTSEFGGAASQRIFRIPANITGQYFKIGFTASVDSVFSVQQLEILAKIGRLA